MDYITVHIDDQMDAKSLLGAYVCTAVPGEFVWQPGPLMQVCCKTLHPDILLSACCNFSVAVHPADGTDTEIPFGATLAARARQLGGLLLDW